MGGGLGTILRSRLHETFYNTQQIPNEGGSVYYCDGNSGEDGNNGKTWGRAFKTLAVAFAASHADMARGSDRWARRNKIYIAGDRFVETLSIAPQKTDIIGVGSCDNFPRACIRGNHAPANAAIGTRWFNVQFEPTTAADIMTLTSATTGMEFHDCDFEAVGTLTAVSAIDTTGHTWLKAIGCTFNGAFTGDVIDIGVGNVDGMVIKDNAIIGGANDGIVVTGATTITTGRMGLIDNNVIKVVAVTIDDGNDDTFIITNNKLISDASDGTGSVNCDIRLCAGNWITSSDQSHPYPLLDTS